MSAVQQVNLSDDVQRVVMESEDVDESFALLTAATDYFVETGKPMTLEDALKTIHRVAAAVEAIG